MINIPLDVDVICTDGTAGKSVSVVVNSVTHKLSHFVVKGRHGVQKMVPIDQIEETGAKSITLKCNLAEFETMDEFMVEHFIVSEQIANYGGTEGAYFTPYTVQKTEQATIKVEEERLKDDEKSIKRGTKIEATDGGVGVVDEFLIDPVSGEVTHVVLKTGQPLGKKEIAIPLSAVKSAVGDKVYLKLDRQEVASLPAVPVHRPWEEVSVADVELIVSTFYESDLAEMALNKLQKLERYNELDVLNAALLVKDEEGKGTFKETGDINPRRGALFGAITGGLIGIVGGPVGIVVGAAAGAATGRVAAGKIDMGFPDEFLKEIEEGLKSGSSALVVLAENQWVPAVVRVMADFDGKSVRQTLADEKVAELLKNIDKS